MKLSRRHIIYIVGWTILLFSLVGMFIAGSQTRKSIKCTELDITVIDSLTNKFINHKDIRNLLDSKYGKYIGISIDRLDLTRMEEIIDSNTAVLKSQAYIGRDGILKIDITQRHPIVRFMSEGCGYYADAEGQIIPLQKNFSSRVCIVDGQIPIPSKAEEAIKMSDPRQIKWFDGVIALVNFMKENESWKDKFVQIHSEANGELTLVPRKGNVKFIFGQPDRIADKFSRIALFYTTIVPEKGMDYYKSVNVTFDGQIICKK